IIVFYSVFALAGSIRSYRECRKKRNAYGLTPQFYMYGAFVYGDMVVFGVFWFFIGVVTLVLHDWLLFLLAQSLFWVVRSIGETIYWFNEQFSTKNRNHPASLPGFHIFNDDSIWYVYQIIAQLITVISLIATIVLIPLWLRSIGIL
ncbi:MAG: hypothetical protein NUV98_05720, partial [Candidatus Roizmanbacteria bacterium]|nr:hypothetical protein [Candidatus Roizmanbacteria bacterium]